LSNGNPTLISYLNNANPTITNSGKKFDYINFFFKWSKNKKDLISNFFLKMYFIIKKGSNLGGVSTICIPTCYASSYNLNAACTYYTVKACDSFSSLANGNTANYNYLVQANPGVTGSNLSIGSTICIPSCLYSQYATNAACTYYTVKPCDTYSSLTNGNTQLQSYLTANNPGITGTSLTAGSQICIPSCYYSQYNLNSQCASYTVKPCDSFSR